MSTVQLYKAPESNEQIIETDHHVMKKDVDSVEKYWTKTERSDEKYGIKLDFSSIMQK